MPERARVAGGLLAAAMLAAAGAAAAPITVPPAGPVATLTTLGPLREFIAGLKSGSVDFNAMLSGAEAARSFAKSRGVELTPGQRQMLGLAYDEAGGFARELLGKGQPISVDAIAARLNGILRQEERIEGLLSDMGAPLDQRSQAMFLRMLQSGDIPLDFASTADPGQVYEALRAALGARMGGRADALPLDRAAVETAYANLTALAREKLQQGGTFSILDAAGELRAQALGESARFGSLQRRLN